VTPKREDRNPIIFKAAIKLFNFYHWPTHLTHLIYTDFTVSYRDALDRLRVRLNSILSRRKFLVFYVLEFWNSSNGFAKSFRLEKTDTKLHNSRRTQRHVSGYLGQTDTKTDRQGCERLFKATKDLCWSLELAVDTSKIYS